MRLFIAIDLGEEIRRSLREYQDALRECGVTGNYSPAENLHLTLAFIGEYGDPDTVLRAMEMPFERFTLETDGIGSFSDTLWAGTAGNEDLRKLVRKLRRSLADAGIPFDAKRFRPHITLVRKAAFRNGDAESLPELPAVSMEVKGISLFRSDRGRHGMIYTELGFVSALTSEDGQTKTT